LGAFLRHVHDNHFGSVGSQVHSHTVKHPPVAAVAKAVKREATRRGLALTCT
jgi:hypothetical protein